MNKILCLLLYFFFFQAEDGIRDYKVTGVQTCALPISSEVYLVLQLPGDGGLRDLEGDERGWLPAADRRVRVRRSADSEEHQERRHGRAGARVHEKLQEAGPCGARRFPGRASR